MGGFEECQLNQMIRHTVGRKNIMINGLIGILAIKNKEENK
jgi:hypothetical protein